MSEPTPYQITMNVDTGRHIRIDFIVEEQSGIVVLVDGVAHDHAEDLTQLKRIVLGIIDKSFSKFKKGDNGQTIT